MAKKQATEATDKYSWAVEGARVFIKSYPLLKGEYGIITSRPSSDAAVVEFGVGQREYIPLRHLEPAVLEPVVLPQIPVYYQPEKEIALAELATKPPGGNLQERVAGGRLPPAISHARSQGENLELSADEECLRHRLELKVEKALSSAWLALKELRDRRLYRSSHKTFEEYAKDRFGYNRAHAYRLIAAAEVIENLSPSRRQNETGSEMSPSGRQNQTSDEMSPNWRQKLPTSERLCRELAKLPAEKQPIAWEKALESSGDKIPNARCAKGIVEQLLEKPRSFASDYCNKGEIFVLQRLEGKDRRYNGYWAVAEEVEERFTVKCRVCNQTLDIRQENMRRVDMTSEQLEQQRKIIERVSRLARCNLDPIVWTMLEALNRQVHYTDVQLKFLKMAEELYGISDYQN